MVYLVGVVVVAMHCRRRISISTSIVSVAAFDLFCVPPYLTLVISDYQYLITFAAMLTTTLAISTQAARIRSQALDAMVREKWNETLYRLSGRLAGNTEVLDIARLAGEYAEELFDGRIIIFLPEAGKIDFTRGQLQPLPIPATEECVAQWALDSAKPAGRGTGTMLEASALYLPLQGAGRAVGVMGILPNTREAIRPEEIQRLEVMANQTAMAIERTRSRNSAQAARIQMQTEQMRSSLLSAVSHDLRTPLSSITGAATTLRSQGDKLEPETRHELLESIADEAERLGRIVSNLLDMTRLDSGIELRRDFYPLEEIVGAALQRMEKELARHRVTTSLPENLPLVYADDVLFGQLVVNLLENASKYTPEGSLIEVVAERVSDAVQLEVRDRGPGFVPGEQERIFEKFYRGRSDGRRGAGLGLAICMAIMEAHEGTIRAFNRSGGGAVFQIRIPLRKQPL